MSTITVPISAGELIDKLTILEIKAERMTDPSKLANVNRERELLSAVRESAVPDSPGIAAATAELREINETLWDIEDAIRDCEKAGDFSDRFIQLARSVYQTNDRRAAVKRTLNAQCGSELIEEKDYS